MTRAELLFFGVIISVFIELLYFPTFAHQHVEKFGASYLSKVQTCLLDGFDAEIVRGTSLMAQKYVHARAEPVLVKLLSFPFEYEAFDSMIKEQESCEKFLRMYGAAREMLKEVKDIHEHFDTGPWLTRMCAKLASCEVVFEGGGNSETKEELYDKIARLREVAVVQRDFADATKGLASTSLFFSLEISCLLEIFASLRRQIMLWAVVLTKRTRSTICGRSNID